MFGIGTGELLLLLVIALLVLGPERMPKLARDLGKTVADLRKTSDELRTEFLNADKALDTEKLLDVAARQAGTTPGPASAPVPEPPSAIPAPEAQASVPPDAGATQAEVVTDHEDTEFDREAKRARERLEDPEAMKEHEAQAKAEGWSVPTDEAGTSPREG